MSFFSRTSITAGLALVLAVPLALAGALPASADTTTVGLGAVGGYAVLGGSAVTNTGNSVLNGSLGVAPGTAISGFDGGPGIVLGGSVYVPPASNAARAAVGIAYSDAAGRTGTVLPAVELAGQNLVSGVYTAGPTGTFGLTGTLTLTGDADDVWIFQTETTLITAFQSAVVLAGGAQACNVFWKVGTSATLGASSQFAGTVLSAASISVGDNVTVRGRLLAGSGAVTLINDVVTMPTCATDSATAAAAAAQAAADAAAAAAAQAAADAAAAEAAAVAAAEALAAAQAAADAAEPGSPEAEDAAAALIAAAEALAEAEEAAEQAAIIAEAAVRLELLLAEDAAAAAAAIVTAAVLPPTGSDPAPVLGAALAVLTVGGLLVYRSRRLSAGAAVPQARP